MTVSELRTRVAQGDRNARNELAARGWRAAAGAVVAMTRDNRLYEPDDVAQQMWVFACEAIDRDKGIGDPVAYARYYIINRIRDWMGMKVRRHAFLLCTVCLTRMAMKNVAARKCKSCGAGAGLIQSVAYIDYQVDDLDVERYRDDPSRVWVADFLSKLDKLEREVMYSKLSGTGANEIAHRLHLTPSKVTQLTSQVRAAWTDYQAVAA